MSDEERKAELAALRARLAALEAEDPGGATDGPFAQPVRSVATSAGSGFTGGFFGCFGVAAAIIAVFFLAALCSKPLDAGGGDQSETAAPPAEPWRYVSFTETMSDKASYESCISSTTEVRLEFPYKDQYPTLCVRVSPKMGRAVMLRLPEGGQFLCSAYRGCNIRVRFDEGQVQTFSGGEPNDGSSDVLFIMNDKRFLAGLRKASRVRIDVEYFRNGVQTMDFPVKGFDATKAGLS